jgi:uncharacterized protein with gpF-like domain
MGIFKKLINKILDTEVPPVVERLVKNGQNKQSKLTPEFGKVMYTEREIPDDSDEAKRIRARQKTWEKMTPAERSKQSGNETKERMVSTGLTMYVWETAGDERVCPACRVMDGKLCRWDNPAVYSRNKGKDWIPRPKIAVIVHPGENICKREGHCRCTALSYEKELFGEI